MPHVVWIERVEVIEQVCGTNVVCAHVKKSVCPPPLSCAVCPAVSDGLE